MRKGLLVLAVLGVVFAAAPVAAQTATIEIFVDKISKFPEGEERVIHTEPVPPALVGHICSGTATTDNNASEHPNNDFIISSGGTSAEILNWEAVAGASVSMSGTVTLGDAITVALRMGPAEISSGGVLIVLTCAQPPPETTTTTTTTTVPPPEPTTTTTAVTPPPETVTTESPPEGGVEAGGGGTASTPNPAAPWVGGAALLLAASLAAVAAGRQLKSKRD